MAEIAKLTVRVTSSRTSSVLRTSTTGRYISTPVNTIDLAMPGQPIFTNASAKGFWTAVLAAVTAEIAALPLCPPQTWPSSYRPFWPS